MKTKLAIQIISLLIALTSLAAAMFLASHHPLSPVLAVSGAVMAAVVCALVPDAWLVLLPALLPIIDLNPWSGWLSFEEFDILLLGAAAGAWLRHGRTAGTAPGRPPSTTLIMVVALNLVLAVIALVRGLHDAGGFEFGWFQGYGGAMNSLRLGKSIVFASLFAPLLGKAMSRRNPRAVDLFGWGMALGLGTAALAATWERLAFPGLLNFSADYRTTALFWEMHVGGAALDGFLALTLPFAALILLRARGLAQLLPAATILAFAVYASLTTFSRGVYMAAIAESAAMVLALRIRGQATPRPQPGSGVSVIGIAIRGAVSGAVAIGLSYLVFRNGGYRSLVAVLGCFGVWMLASEAARQASTRNWVAGAGLGALLTAVALLAAWLHGKAPYWAYGAMLAVAISAILGRQYLKRGEVTAVLLAAMLALPVAAAQIAAHWGGTQALADSTIPLLLIAGLGLWNIRATQSAWPTERRKQAALLAAVCFLAGLTVVFSGGKYMGSRFSSSEGDLESRMKHWQSGLALMNSAGDWLLGKGLGRFPATFFFGELSTESPGRYRLVRDGQNPVLSLTGPRNQDQMLVVSQRVRLGPTGHYHLELDTRAATRAKLWLSICTKHLLYVDNCATKVIELAPKATGWQHLALDFDGRQLRGGTWSPIQLAVFSIALDIRNSRVDVDNLSLVDAGGRPMLANGDFSADMARWFFTSDHYHLPWHMKNMFLHILFEQGIIGFAAISLMILCALTRSLNGRRSHNPLAPAIFAGIVGFLVVGIFDSLLDVPRVAFLFFLVMMIAIQGRKQDE